MQIKQIVIGALLLRLLIMPFFFHPDIKDIHLRTSFLSQGVLNIYDHLKQHPITKINAPDFVYPPATYFTLGSYQILVSPFLGDAFPKWLFDFSGLSASNLFIFRYLLILKLPYLIFDFLVGFLLFKIARREDQTKTLFLWFFNPLTLYGIYAIGQFDIIPTFLSIFSLYLWHKKAFSYSGLALGLGIAFKSFPIIFIPFFLLSKESSLNKLKYLFSILFVYMITMLPFITSPGFQHDVLFSDFGKRVLEAQINLGPLSISIFILLYATLLLIQLKNRAKPLWIFMLSALLITFSVARFHPHWIVWLTPFLVIAIVSARINLWLIALLCLTYFSIFIFYGDRFLTTGLLSPISTIYLEIPSFTQLIPQTHITNVQLALQLIFACISFVIIRKVLTCRYD